MRDLLFVRPLYAHYVREAEAEDIISGRVVNATDGSLPRKPCKTCKNRFHAACLYKVSLAAVSVYLSRVLISLTVVQLESLVELPAVSF